MTKRITKGIAKLLSVLVCLTVLLTACFSLAACGDTVELSATEHTMYVSDTFRLTATTSDEDALIEWTSSDSSVASVRRGVVTAEKAGTATITATTDSGATATCDITVLDRTLTISQTEAALDVVGVEAPTTITLTATSTVSTDTFTWATSDPAVATVEGGVVTAVGMGTATITASVGSMSVYCIVTVDNSSLPDDYRVLAKGQNSAVAADAGVWYYHADGNENSSYSFMPGGTPSYQDGGVQVTLATLSSGYFRFRYQPGGKDETGVEIGDNFTISFTVESNIDTRLGCSAGSSITVTANTPVEVTRSAAVGETPFYVSLNSELVKDSIPAEGLYLRLGNIKVEKMEDPVYDDNGELDQGKMSVVSANPGIWFYNAADSAVFSAKPNYDAEEGVLSVTADSWGSDAFYFRYQPSEEDDGFSVGDFFTVSFTVQTDFDTNVRYGYEGAHNAQVVPITANTPLELTMESTAVGEDGLFFVSVCTPDPNDSSKFGAPASAGTFTVSEIVFEAAEANPVVDATISAQPTKVDYITGETFDPTGMVLDVTYADQTTGQITVTDPAQVSFDAAALTEGQTSVEVTVGEATVTVTITVSAAPQGTALPQGSMGTVRANPGVWHYNAGSGAAFVVAPYQNEEEGVFSVVASSWGKDSFYFRYQPTEEQFANGTQFTVTFTVETDFDTEVRYGYEGADNAVHQPVQANTPTQLTMTATRDADGLFFVCVCGASGSGAPAHAGGTFTVSNVTFAPAAA